MLIIIVLFVLAVVGIAVFIYGNNHYSFHEAIAGIGLGIGIVCAIAFAGTVAFATCNSIVKETDYQDALFEKQVIEYRLENKDDNIVGNEMLYNDIVAFNNMLRGQKKWATNPWTNVFNNDLIASIDYIELE